MLTINEKETSKDAQAFCRDFNNLDAARRIVFGTNEYAGSIAEHIEIGSFIDDFTDNSEYMGKPVIRSKDVPKDAMVISAVVLGRPLTANKVLDDLGVRHLDYYSYYENSGFELMPVTFWKDFPGNYHDNREKFNRVYELLEDKESRRVYERLLNFRLTGNLSYMAGFTDRQKEQYFEDFLGLKDKDEVFVDVGGFDGFTSLEFIKRCPGYKKIYFLEPDEKNMKVAESRLAQYDNIEFVSKGLSNEPGVVRFSTGGSASVISDEGDVEIHVDKLDSIVNDDATFIKMDIEGAEGLAIEGARETIKKCHPILALCVYHKAGDFWEIPEQVLSIRDDYKLYLRHYTEGVTETVMFFVPVEAA